MATFAKREREDNKLVNERKTILTVERNESRKLITTVVRSAKAGMARKNYPDAPYGCYQVGSLGGEFQ